MMKKKHRKQYWKWLIISFILNIKWKFIFSHNRYYIKYEIPFNLHSSDCDIKCFNS